MAKTKQQKQNDLNTIKQQLSESTAVVFTDFTGLSANNINQLRAKLNESGAKVIVTKNSLLQKANEELKLQGQTAAIFAKEKTVEPIKELYNFIKQNELPVVKMGMLNGEVISEEKVKQLSTLPSIDELRAKLVGSLMAPVSGFAMVANGVGGSFVRVLNAYKESKQ